MTQTLASIAVGPEWVDLTSGRPSLASVDVDLQVHGTVMIAFVFGGASAPTDAVPGTILEPQDSIRGNSANIWARGLSGHGVVSPVLI